MENVKYYELTSSQDVSVLQTKFSLDKRVMNICMSATSDEPIDFKVMKEALDLVAERNDCIRLRFKKQGKKVVQWFLPKVDIGTVPYYEFADKQAQTDFIKSECHKAIKWLKGEVFKPVFIKTYDNKGMVFLKIAHTILDIYGLNVIFKDLFEVYNALINKTELPKAPKSFEELVKKDLVIKNDPNRITDGRKYFLDFFKSYEEPWYAGADAGQNKFVAKKRKQGKRYVNTAIFSNTTEGYIGKFGKEITQKLEKFAMETKISMNLIMEYLLGATCSKMNGEVETIMPLELCNVRGTLQEKTTAGTKVQTLGMLAIYKKEKTLMENLNAFNELHSQQLRHIGFPDLALQKLFKCEVYGRSMLAMYYPFSFSFIPMDKIDGINFEVYSNDKGALPCYIAVMYDFKNSEMLMVYDYQKVLMTNEQIDTLHKNFERLLVNALENPDKLLKDIKY
ncbi:MAG: hypothetical protein E7378_04170 [Clostridiales bacterium]|nr:hypothetical protein [Clostridiales bacterium]